jgi:hypothetical protein
MVDEAATAVEADTGIVDAVVKGNQPIPPRQLF